MTNEPLLIFLDANVLAKPLTRTLVLRCQTSGYTAAWSQAAEDEANRHLRPGQTHLDQVRGLADLLLSATGEVSGRFLGTPAGDRQILADSHMLGATFLVTEDVDDFVVEDLAAAGMSAANPDLFLAERTTVQAYQTALHDITDGMSNPARTPEQLHASIARQHPRLFTRHASLYDVTPQASEHRRPAVVFRGTTCLRCLATPSDPVGQEGLCSACTGRSERSRP